MNPASAMGTFIRTWRAEWAGLSRAQLAIAMNGKLDGSRRISGGTVQRWEEGQPPKSTEELEALCGVMRKHGLVPLELKQFRRAVFAACAGRQFPELLNNDEWVCEDTVDEVTHAVALPEHDMSGSVSIVDLVAIESELTRAVRDAKAEGVGRRQAERQRRALLYAIDALKHTSALRSRLRVVGALATKVLSLAEAYSLGPRPGGNSVPRWQVSAAVGVHPDDPHARGWHLFRMGEKADRRGERDLAREAVQGGVYAAINWRDRELLDFAWAHRGLLEPHYGHMVGWVASARNRPRDAEPYIDLWPPQRPGNTGQQWLRARSMASFAMAAGNRGEAEEYLGEAFDIAQRWGAPGCIDQVLRELKLCETARQKTNRRKKRTTSNGKTNQSGKKRKK